MKNIAIFILPIRFVAPVFFLWHASVDAKASESKPAFNRDIRPILSDKCFACHGTDAKHREAKLRLDLAEGAFRENEGIIPIKPGDLKNSDAWARITSNDKDEMMPPPKSHKVLSNDEKELIRRWIEQGAVYEKHWAFEQPVKAEPPAIKEAARVRNPIDAFLFARLEKEGFSPSPEADKSTLLRRATLAITGLPPAPQELDAFLADAAPDAYGRLIDRLLASPRFGEHMAHWWLDLARYGDTHGMHLDNERQMWLYRDWVIDAFNQNIPFDQFTVEQLAGDQLPNASNEQKIATGFNRCNASSGEGGAIAEELRFRYSLDRMTTTVQTWLGLTAQCATCHDHKFDPITQKEVYQLHAFFNSAADPALDGNNLKVEPVLPNPTMEQKAQLAGLAARLAETRKKLDGALANVSYSDAAGEAAATSELRPGDLAAGGVDDPSKDPARSFAAWLKSGEGKDTPNLPPDVNVLLKKNSAQSAANELSKLRDYFLRKICASTRGVFEPLEKEIAALEKERTDLEAALPATFVMGDTATPRDSFVMERGQYDRPGEKVQPGTPAILPPLAVGNPKRLDLARWLVDSKNPLTARVIVNRFWQQFFGLGLVKTSADFGSQGEAPSNPELLDWLAVNFRENGWDMKLLVKTIVTSSAWRQTSRVTPELLARDPENRLIGRGPRMRLNAEAVRDEALFASGLLVEKIGGRGVRTYQPPNIWEPVAYKNSNTHSYKQDTGDALYRRSIYTFLKRTAPAPFLANFDAPSREGFCTRREQSDTPLQALQLLNDVQFFEAARVLAQRVLAGSGSSNTAPEARLAESFRIVLGRLPEPPETERLITLLNQFLARYRADVEAAKAVLSNGETKPPANADTAELAAWTQIGNLLLNFDEATAIN